MTEWEIETRYRLRCYVRQYGTAEAVAMVSRRFVKWAGEEALKEIDEEMKQRRETTWQQRNR